MNFKKIASKLMISLLTAGMLISPLGNIAHADAFKTVTLGGNLNEKQKEDMLKYFNVNKNEANIEKVTIEEEFKYLGKVASKSQLGSKSISCSYVEPTDKGGLNVTLHNIYWVNENMIKNALITAGIKNANVKAAAPFRVSGTAALTGILKAFENTKSGEKIDEDKKKAANEEIVVTGNLGDKIGKDKAAGLVNEVKKEVVEKKPETKKETEKIVKKVTNNYNYNLDDQDINKLTDLMNNISKLDLNIDQLKDQLNSMGQKLDKFIKSDETQGFLKKLWNGIGNFFSNLF
ncbi:DUF1002 domain-containing protein [Clostridium oceanicum]|uniref:DUF1002 domain-containing protein n=1 Tax=Clostridium oceanicum TaxID=1543 RepID=A0ABP3UFC2_9CLOT